MSQTSKLTVQAKDDVIIRAETDCGRDYAPDGAVTSSWVPPNRKTSWRHIASKPGGPMGYQVMRYSVALPLLRSGCRRWHVALLAVGMACPWRVDRFIVEGWG